MILYVFEVDIFMRRIIVFFAAALLFLHFSSSQVCAQGFDVSISAASAVLIEAQTGKILYAKNENEKRPMASTTKIMTALICLESGNLDEQFVVDSSAIKVGGSSMGLVEGDIVTKRSLCIGMLLPSGNDAANAAAIKIAGSFEKFAEMMNERAAKIGMLNTHFITPSGLDAEGHYSTAYDMALLAREALKNPDFKAICSQKNIKLSYGNPPYDRWLKNTNKLLTYYNGCIGVKTGFTDAAGRCLVSATERNGVCLICVTLKAPDDWADHQKMLNYGFSIVKNYDLPVPAISQIGLVGGFKDNVGVSLASIPKASLTEEDFSKVQSAVFMDKFVYAPVKSGKVVGRVKYSIDGKEILSVPVIVSENADAEVTQKEKSFWDNLFERFNIFKNEK